jgi:hypothetical protein
MSQLQTQAKQSVAEVAREFADANVIDAKELRMILNAVALLKKNSGWGELELVYKSCDLNDVNILIHQKPAKDV